MIYLLYLFMVPVSLVLTLVAYVLSPILPLFAVQKLWWCDNHSYQAIGPVLPTWLNWFMTPDNSLDGDRTFEQINGRSYWAKVKWLWRNPAYSVWLKYINTIQNQTYVSGDDSIKDNDNAKAGHLLVKADGLFQYVYIKQIFSTNRCIYVNLGWNIRSLVDPNVPPKQIVQATFVFSPRISGFR